MKKYLSAEVNNIDCCKQCNLKNDCNDVCLNIKEEYCAKQSCTPGGCLENGKFTKLENKKENYIYANKN